MSINQSNQIPADYFDAGKNIGQGNKTSKSSETLAEILENFRNDLKVAVIEIPTSEILTLHTTPVELVEAPGDGKWIDFVSAKITAVCDTTALNDASAQGDLQVVNASGQVWGTCQADGLVDVTAGNSASKSLNADGSGTQNRDCQNEGIELKNSAGAFTDPGSADTVLEVEVIYRVRTL